MAQNETCALRYAEKRVLRHIYLHPQESLEELRHVVKLNAPARENNSLLHNVRHKLRGRYVKHILNRTGDFHKKRVERFRDLVRVDNDVLRKACYKVSPAKLVFFLVFCGDRRANLD